MCQRILLFVHAFGYMVELTVTGWCIIATYIAISNWFELTTCFLTFYCDPYFLSQIQIFYILYSIRANVPMIYIHVATYVSDQCLHTLLVSNFLISHLYIYVYYMHMVHRAVGTIQPFTWPDQLWQLNLLKSNYNELKNAIPLSQSSFW